MPFRMRIPFDMFHSYARARVACAARVRHSQQVALAVANMTLYLKKRLTAPVTGWAVPRSVRVEAPLPRKTAGSRSRRPRPPAPLAG